MVNALPLRQRALPRARELSKIFYRLEGDQLRRAARVASPGDLGQAQQKFHDDSGQKQAFGIGQHGASGSRAQ